MVVNSTQSSLVLSRCEGRVRPPGFATAVPTHLLDFIIFLGLPGLPRTKCAFGVRMYGPAPFTTCTARDLHAVVPIVHCTLVCLIG
jgi:hypothetical protein